MTNAELIACIQAEEQGKRVERFNKISKKWDLRVPGTTWDTALFEYRIAREPRKCWVRFLDGGALSCVHFEEWDNVKDLESKGWQLVVEEIR